MRLLGKSTSSLHLIDLKPQLVVGGCQPVNLVAELQELARYQATDLTHLVRLEGKGGAKTAKIFFATGETAKIFFATGETARIPIATTESGPDLSSYLGSRKNATSATRPGSNILISSHIH